MNVKNNIKYSVVIPVFNEAGNLEVLYARLTKVMHSLDGPYEIIFVDDGSMDKTLVVLKEIHRENEKVNNRCADIRFDGVVGIAIAGVLL